MKKVTVRNKVCYACNVCGFAYSNKEIADECEAYCTAFHECNPEITSKAVNKKENKGKKAKA